MNTWRGNLPPLKRGIDNVQLLSDPAYTAQNEYAELDDEWLARMLGALVILSNLRQGVCRYVCQYWRSTLQR